MSKYGISKYFRESLGIQDKESQLYLIKTVLSGATIHLTFRNYPKTGDREAWASSLDPDQMLQNAASDQRLHCLPLIQQFLHSSLSIDSKMDLFKF